MKMSKMISKFCYAKPYRKASKYNRNGFDMHTNPTAIKKLLHYSDSEISNNQFIDLYNNIYRLPKSEFRIVSRTIYKNHIAYKVYDKLRCYYRVYSPFYNEFSEVKQ